MNSWYARAAGVALASIYFLRCAATPAQWHFIDGANLIFHEAGHAIFIFFGQFIHVLMGSGFQVALPAFLAGYFFYTGQKLSAAVCLMWAGQSLVNVSIYAGDALAMQLPLLGGDGVMHDWHYLLSTTNFLYWTPQVAGTLYATGTAAIFAGVAAACTLLFREYKQLAK
ncbi:MAG TPA: hypothetical protein VHD55_00755 [Candidatus Paceibacterota bacterium]|nr:hypothetical protein [Candidatus Paceibacterota bacterium]